MRRMLDPKEAGGSVKQYCHFIEISTKDSEQIYFNYISTDETKATKETIVSVLKDKKLICTGYVRVNNAAKSIEYIKVLRTELSVKWIDLTTLANSTKEITISYMDDKVFPVS